MRATRLIALVGALIVVLALVAIGQQAVERRRHRASTQALIDTIQSVTGTGLAAASPRPTDAVVATRLAYQIERGAVVNAFADTRYSDCKWATPLHVAAGRGLVESTKVLIDAGAAVNAVDSNGETPLANCVRKSSHALPPGAHFQTAALLIKAGANVHHRLRNGRGILDIVVGGYSDRKMARLLKDAGAKETPAPVQP